MQSYAEQEPLHYVEKRERLTSLVSLCLCPAAALGLLIALRALQHSTSVQTAGWDWTVAWSCAAAAAAGQLFHHSSPFDRRWTVDSTGIGMDERTRGRFMPWDAVNRLTISYSIDHFNVEVWGNGKRLRIDRVPLPMLLAIHTYSQTSGRLRKTVVAPEFESLWIEIPDGTPNSVEWTNPAPVTRDTAIGMGICAMMAVMTLIILWLSPVIGVLFCLIAIPTFQLRARRQMAPQVRQVKVDDAGIQVRHPSRTDFLPWQRLDVFGYDGERLILGERSRRRLELPVPVDHADGRELILCIVKHMRQSGPPYEVPIPGKVLEAMVP